MPYACEYDNTTGTNEQNKKLMCAYTIIASTTVLHITLSARHNIFYSSQQNISLLFRLHSRSLKVSVSEYFANRTYTRKFTHAFDDNVILVGASMPSTVRTCVSDNLQQGHFVDRGEVVHANDALGGLGRLCNLYRARVLRSKQARRKGSKGSILWANARDVWSSLTLEPSLNEL